MQNYSASIGESITMVCDVCSNPPALFQWWLNGSNLTEVVDGNRSNLTISDIQEYEFGFYVCTASNKIDGREESRNFRMFLSQDPSDSTGKLSILYSKEIMYIIYIYIYIDI